MYGEELNKVADASAAKKKFLDENPIGYFISSMSAGLYISVAIMLIFTIGGYLDNASSPFTKIAMGASFGVSLSLVIMAGAELFTGNNFVITTGLLKKRVRGKDLVKNWVVSYIGNFFGAILGAYMFFQAGLASGSVGEFISTTSATRMAASPIDLFFKGVLCNILVCLAVWCSFKLKDEVAKLIMIWWCLFVFVTCGFEQCIANMALLAIGLFIGGNPDVTIMGFINNVTWVTLGNIVGGVLFVAIPYFFVGKEKTA